MEGGCRSKPVNVASGVPQSSVLGELLFLLYTSRSFSILVNKLIGYADDSTLMTVVPSPDVRVAESLLRDPGRVSEWCDLRGMKLNTSITKAMILRNSLLVLARNTWGCPGKYSIIESFMGEAFGFFPARFGVLFCSVMLGCQYTP